MFSKESVRAITGRSSDSSSGPAMLERACFAFVSSLFSKYQQLAGSADSKPKKQPAILAHFSNFQTSILGMRGLPYRLPNNFCDIRIGHSDRGSSARECR